MNLNNISKFWKRKINLIYWRKKPKIILNFNLKKKKYFWFLDGKLSIYYNCITNYIEKGFGKKIAIYFVDEKKNISKFSYLDIDILVNKFLNYIFFLEKKKKKKIKKIIIHSSASIDTAVIMLACARQGIHFSVIFEELEKDAILKRTELFKPQLILTKKNNLLDGVYKDIVLDINNYKKFSEKKISLKYFLATRKLFTLFTSGSTGMPKGITHSTGGYFLYAKLTSKVKFGIDKNSFVLTASDAGWINGHTYALFGPLALGAKTVIIQRPIQLIDQDLLNIILNLGVTVLYLPVTLIRLMKSIFINSKRIKLANLKVLGSMGEPLANSVARWYANQFTNGKKLPIVNTYFQTETGGIICSHDYNSKISTNELGSVGSVVVNSIKLNKLSHKIKKEIKVTTPWPGMMIDVLNGKKEWNKYWDNLGNFRMFDFATKKNNNIFIHGRVDDVINIRGHRIGAAEIESCVLTLKEVIECSVISISDNLEGGKIFLFAVVKFNKNISKKIEENIISNFGTFALPKKIIIVKELPKTRSGKIVRRLLRSIANYEDEKNYGDLSTLSNKYVVSHLTETFKNA